MISSDPIDIVSARLYTRKTEPLITSTDQLNGKNIGHLIGQLGVKLLKNQKGITFSAVTNGESMIKMITKGRIDAILGFHPDTLISMHRLDFNELHYAEKLALFEVPIHMVCHKTPQNQSFIQTINLRIKEAHKKKLLQSMLENEAQIAPFPKIENTN
ncbi:MAG: ABC-type amino acid transport substrate-binding protein [Oceanospirillaceae bacterium]